MTIRLVLRPSARVEIETARGWYASGGEALAKRFVASVDEVVTRIIERPLAHPKVHRDLRRVPLRRFPYAVYFRLLGDEAVIVAIVHGHRHPASWQSRR